MNTVADAPVLEMGNQTEDVLLALKHAVETLGQLGELFAAINEKSGEHSAIAKLANLGQYVADDISNYIDCIHGDFERQVQQQSPKKLR